MAHQHPRQDPVVDLVTAVSLLAESVVGLGRRIEVLERRWHHFSEAVDEVVYDERETDVRDDALDDAEATEEP